MTFEGNIKDLQLANKINSYIEIYERVQKIVDKFPLFKDYIIENKITKEFGKIGDSYKKIYFAWGVNRYKLKDENISNFNRNKDKEYILNEIYINTLSLYDRHDKYGLEDLGKYVFFFDERNTTFYATDEELPILLEELNKWFLKADKQACKESKEEKKKELLKNLKDLKEWNVKEK